MVGRTMSLRVDTKVSIHENAYTISPSNKVLEEDCYEAHHLKGREQLII
jgi:hypothetical protein